MLLSGSANRAKSWSCENCDNWKNTKDKKICLSCYWAYPESYAHIAGWQVRRIDLIWQNEDITIYEELKKLAENSGNKIPEFVREIIAKEITRLK